MADLSAELDLQDFSKWKVADLKKELKARGLNAIGNKNELVERLQLSVHGIEGGIEEGVLMAETDSVAADNDSVAADTEGILDEDEVLGEDDTLDDEIDISKDESLEISPTKTMGKRKLSEENDISSNTSKKIVLNRAAVHSPEKENLDSSDQKPKLKVLSNEDLGIDKKNVDKKVSEMTQQERLQLRASKFGAKGSDKNSSDSSEDKKAARAIRFGLSSSNSSSVSSSSNIEALKKRAERFGTVVSPEYSKVDQADRLKKRQERFGVVASNVQPDSLKSMSVDEKKRLRAERFKTK